MKTPLIGVTASYIPPQKDNSGAISVGEAYILAVSAAGGLPVVIPVGLSATDLAALFSRLDGILLTGGGDMNPGLFQGARHPRVYGIDERRDHLEIELARLATDRGKPFLGICRGIQVINVALGGTLYTHIADQLDGALKHDYYPDPPRDYLAHPVSVVPGSRLAGILGGDHFEVNSLHHQGIERLASPLVAVARTPDSLIEGVELPDHPFGIGVQWHPEALQAHDPQRRLFKTLIQAAARESVESSRSTAAL